MMPVKVNPLTLQDLFYRVMADLEYAQHQLYNDDISRVMKYECEKQRREYVNKFKEILKEDIS